MARPAASVGRRAYFAWFITAPLAAFAAVLMYDAASRREPLFSSLGVTIVYFALFCAAEATTLKLEVRRDAIQMSVTEVPLLLALFYLTPLTVLIVRVLASLLVQSIRGVPIVKMAFNVTVVAAGTAVASLIVVSFRVTNVAPSTWLVLMGAVSVAMLVTVTAVLGVISLMQGRFSIREVYNSAIPSLIIGTINAAAGLAVLLIIHVSRWAILLLVGLATAIVVIYRAYAQFLRQHKSLTEIYDLTRAIAENPHDGTVADVVLQRVRGLLHADYATLWLPAQGRYPESQLSARPDDRGLIDLSGTPDAIRQQAVETGNTIFVSPKTGDDDLRAVIREAGTKDAIVVPLRSGGAVIGTLEVTGRMSDSYFSTDDVRLLETLAAHAAVAVENSRLVDRLRFDAYHDSLTGLPNRRRLVAALQEAVKIRAPGEVVTIMILDVDGLRDVNDSLGHAAGDKLLVEFAQRLRALCPPAALVARIGGDEFAVTLRITDADAAVALAGDLRDALRHPMEIGSLSLDIDAAVGIAVHPDHGSDPATLLQRADVATHAAKSQSSALQLFDPSLESRSVRRLGLAGDLRRALDNHALEVYFQPKVALPTRQLVGVECLARWDHPVHGAVVPEDFVAVAEHTGQLTRLTDFVLREGMRRCKEWTSAGRPLPIAVNLSPRTIVDHEFPDRVESLLAEYNIAPGMLTLEITEDGVIGETDRPMPTLRRLDALGVRLSVDDFGTGYSSLSYLRRLPVDEVKIDRSFVQGMATDPGDLAIVRAIVDLARHFGLSVVAEGVESELTLSLLADMGCDIGQGFLFSRPLPYDRLEAWLGAQTDAEPTATGEVRRLRAVP